MYSSERLASDPFWRLTPGMIGAANNIGGRIQVSLAALRSNDWLGGDLL
jgi:hypothetical protein